TLANLHSQTRLNYWDLSVPVIFSPEVERKIIEAHRALIDALTARDGDKAESIARDHIQLTMEIVLNALEKSSQVFSP
ncbi:MAG: FCD domain-containing protein, partial [Anaerolineales bacterium]|nr:FCD domain-containing protein [Anaerolineales bacterium]